MASYGSYGSYLGHPPPSVIDPLTSFESHRAYDHTQIVRDHHDRERLDSSRLFKVLVLYIQSQ